MRFHTPRKRDEGSSAKICVKIEIISCNILAGGGKPQANQEAVILRDADEELEEGLDVGPRQSLVQTQHSPLVKTGDIKNLPQY